MRRTRPICCHAGTWAAPADADITFTVDVSEDAVAWNALTTHGTSVR